MEKWLEVYAKPSVRANTFLSYETMAKNHIIPLLGFIKLLKLQPIHIQQMVNEIIAKGGSPRLAEYVFSILRIAIRQAVNDQLLLRAPTASVSLPRKQKNEIEPLKTEEWDKLLTTAQKSPDMYTALLLEWASGLRRGELLGLRWSDVNFNAGTIDIARAVIITDRQPMLAEPKTLTSYRRLPLPVTVMDELRQHKTRQTAERLKAGEWQDQNLIFPTNTGGLQDPRNWSKKYARIITEAGLRHINFHVLRHDHASRMVDNNVPLKDAQYRMGHSSARMLLDVYSHRVDGGQEKISAWLTATTPAAALNHSENIPPKQKIVKAK
ncbi:integrase [Sporomusaceae bacterium BoRhaA]|nr:integrase [Pelorhabdus rhamnosifermentans]